jgi:hypothetical protein
MNPLEVSIASMNFAAIAASIDASSAPALRQPLRKQLRDACLLRQRQQPGYDLVASVDRKRILEAAGQYLPVAPQTITAFPSHRSPGGLHDFFSEADYFWPNPANPDGPYIQLDGKSNPANFQGHRKAMIALSVRMPALTAAWRLTG